MTNDTVLKHAVELFERAHEARKIKAFEKLYVARGEPDGWPEELFYDEKSGAVYLSYHFMVEGRTRKEATAIVRIVGEDLEEVSEIPGSLTDFSDLIPEL